jgi:molybdopterin/thiamine biosynthesis adenylyltransferase
MSNKVSFNPQLGIFNPTIFEDKSITIIGAGAIGSFTALTLAKMGISHLIVYDFDKITPHNIPNQFYKIKHVGKLKTKSLLEIINEFSECELTIKDAFLSRTRIESDIVICLADNMEVRKMVFNKCVRANIPFLDARMGGEFMRVYAVETPAQRKIYRSTLYSTGQSETTRCTERSIIYNPLLASAYIAILVKKILYNEEHPVEILGDQKNVSLYVS